MVKRLSTIMMIRVIIGKLVFAPYIEDYLQKMKRRSARVNVIETQWSSTTALKQHSWNIGWILEKELHA